MSSEVYRLEELGTEPISATSAPDLRPITRQRQILVLISSFLTIIMTIGFSQAYGVFQSYYTSPTQTLLSTNSTSGALVAFVGTLGYGLTWGGSIVVNPIMARLERRFGAKGTRGLGVLGSVLMSLGFGLASLSTEAWHLLLTQGFLFGIGSSLLYFPILNAAPEYFNRHRGAAMGFIFSGAGIGGILFSSILRALLSSCGPRTTLLIMALLTLVLTLPIALTSSPTRFVGHRPTHVSLNLALRPSFLFSVGAAFLQAGGNGVPITFVAEYSVALGYSSTKAAGWLAVMNAVNSVSRVGTGWVGDKWGRQNVLIGMVVASVVCVGALWGGSAVEKDGGKGLWIAFVVVYGMAGGGYNALFPTTVAEVFGLQAYASVNGFMYFMRGLGTMVGGPVGGQILGESKIRNYRSLVWFDAALLGGAALCVLAVRFWDAVDKRRWNWRA